MATTCVGKARRVRHHRVIRVTEPKFDKHGARLLVRDIPIEGWWTSLGG